MEHTERRGREKVGQLDCARKFYLIFFLINLYRKAFEMQRALEEERVRNYQRLLDEAKEYSLRKAILEDSVQYFDSKI